MTQDILLSNSENPSTTLNTENTDPAAQDQKLLQAVRRLNGNILGLVLGLVTGFIIFASTLFLVMKGGDSVGPHLALLGQFFIGYKVTVLGGFIGLIYGFIVGFVEGWFIAWVYNAVVSKKTKQG